MESKDPGLRRQAAARLTSPFVRLAARTGISPNALTLIGLAIGLIAASMVAIGHTLAGGLVLLFSGLFDMLDGAVARKTGRSTKFGALMDSIIDRVSEAALLFGVLILYTSQGFSAGILVVLLALVGSFLTSYVRARAEGLGLTCSEGFFTRAERVIVLAIGLLVNQVFVALLVIAALSYVTVVERMVRVWRQARSQ